MARVKVSPDAGVNPLVRMFGVALRMERLQLNQSSGAMATKLGLSDTYLRLVESGRALVGQTLAFTLIKVYGQEAKSPIEFERLAIFMVSMQWIGAQMAEHPTDINGKEALKALAAQVADFEIFYERVKSYFDKSGEDQQKFLEEVAAPEVRAFLSSSLYATMRADIGRTVAQVGDLSQLPTLNVELLLKLKDSFEERSFVHTARITSKWESKRQAEFRRERGLYLRADLIVSLENLNCFHYEHLSSPRFNCIQMIFIHSDVSADELKLKFVELLNAGREKAEPALKPITEGECKKIQFYILSKNNKSHDVELNNLRTRDATSSTPLDAYWSFEMDSGLQIGFVGLHNDNKDNVSNLTLRDSLERARLFDKVWNELVSKSSC